MKSFLAIFTCAENSKNHLAWKQLSPEAQRERLHTGMRAKEEWIAKYKNQIIYNGGDLGEDTKIVDTLGIHNAPSKMGAFLVIKANSHEEAAKMFVDHPHFSIFPGDGVEILERVEHRGPTE